MNIAENLGAFIITYNRPREIKNTIEELWKQTLQPKVVLIIDHSDNDQTKEVINEINSERLEYFATEVNGGPALGSYLGLKMLKERGFEWGVWLDDDNPPFMQSDLENLYNFTHLDKIGVLGCSGSKFDTSKRALKRIHNSELEQELIDVQMVGGGQLPMVNLSILAQEDLPFKDLFFSFEDLDLGLKITKKGYRVVVPGALLRRRRELKNRIDFQKNRSRNVNWRNYYSIRSLTYLLIHIERDYLGVGYVFVRNLIKSFTVYGVYNKLIYLNYTIRGVYDAIFNRLGIRIQPQSKSKDA